MTNKQDANSKVGAEPRESLKDGAETKISSTPGKDAVGDHALDDVSGGLWPRVTTGSTYNKTI
ncbi:hypothetical protein [Bradyrhizobium liaoningense]|uniref:hypothetical protein n=1 Tax=Bradyrhizobium liaoningense TaxID=43992 RepID=UPI001BA656DE|nr:hypothetical protein [Bradyrhizobium liaoningense]